MANRIAYIAARFPLRSETFVHREVSWLRGHGWSVRAVSLNEPREAAAPELAPLRADRIVVYGSRKLHGLWSALVSALGECVANPVRSAATLATATCDAVAPGEKLSLIGRFKLLAQAMAGLSLARRLRGDQIRYIHCHFAHAPTSVGMYAAMQLGIGFGFTGHANDLFHRRQLLRRKLLRARLVVCISHWHRDLYTSIAGERPAYRVIRCGVDEAGWRPAVARSDDERGSGRLRVLSVCRLVEKKGIDTLVRAVGILVRGGRAVELTIAGDGPDRNRLASIAGESGCRTAVAWLGAVDHGRVHELLGTADMFVLPCRTDRHGDRDGIPVALMEAMACGVASIGGNLPAIGELIEHGRSGMLVDGTNAEELAKRIAELADDAQLRMRLGEAGRQRVIEEFSTEANMGKMQAAIEEAIGGARPPGNLGTETAREESAV